MNRPFILPHMLCWATIVLAGCADADSRDLAELVQSEGRYLDPADFNPYSGSVFSLFDQDSAQIELESSLRNGRFQGPYRRYYRSGSLFGRGRYEAGQWDGGFQSFYEDGSPWTTGTYRLGALVGPYEELLEDGSVFERGTYDALGNPCGEWEEDGQAVTYDPCS